MKIAFVLIYLGGGFMTPNAIAGDALDEEGREKLIDLYERVIFPAPDSRVTRFQNTGIVDVNIQCLHEQCGEHLEKLKSILPRSRFNIVQRDFSSDDLISIVLAEKSADALNLRGQDKIPLLPNEKIVANGSITCGGFNYRTGTRIKRLIIISNQSLSANETAFCSLYQIMIGSGVPARDSFETMWSSIATQQDIEISPLVKNISRILSIHFFTGFAPGATRSEFIAAIEKQKLQDVMGE